GTRHDPHRPRSRSPSVRCRSTSRYGAGENSAKASTKYTTSRAGSSRRRCSARPHAATTRSTKSGGHPQANPPSPDSSGTPSATGTTPDSAPAAYAPTNATALPLDGVWEGASPPLLLQERAATLPPGPHRPDRRRLAAACPLIPIPKPGGRPAVQQRRKTGYRDAVWLRAGCAWRLLPTTCRPARASTTTSLRTRRLLGPGRTDGRTG